MIFILLPNQLFDKKHLDKKQTIHLWEHPHYFKDYNYNKKLVLHRASMRSYFEYLVKNKFKVEYVPFDKQYIFKEGEDYSMYDPINKLKRLKLDKENITILDSLISCYQQNYMKNIVKKQISFFLMDFICGVRRN